MTPPSRPPEVTDSREDAAIIEAVGALAKAAMQGVIVGEARALYDAITSYGLRAALSACPPAPAEAAVSDKVFAAVQKALRGFRTSEYLDAQDDGLSLVDILTPPGSLLARGERDLERLTDSVYEELHDALDLLASPPVPGAPAGPAELARQRNWLSAPETKEER